MDKGTCFRLFRLATRIKWVLSSKDRILSYELSGGSSILSGPAMKIYFEYDTIQIDRNKLSFLLNGKEVFWMQIPNFDVNTETLLIQNLEGSVTLNEQVYN